MNTEPIRARHGHMVESSIASLNISPPHALPSMYLAPIQDVAFEIGRFYYGIREYENALKFYRDSSDNVGQHHVTFHNMGLCYYSMGEIFGSANGYILKHRPPWIITNPPSHYHAQYLEFTAMTSFPHYVIEILAEFSFRRGGCSLLNHVWNVGNRVLAVRCWRSQYCVIIQRAWV